MAEEYYEKKYKEALERARDLVSKDNVEVAEYIFPELTDLNDEKIRKALVRFHKSTIDIDGIKGVDILAWLEKQGNCSAKWQKNTPDNKPAINHSVLMKTTYGIVEGEWHGEHWFQYRWSCTLKDSDVLYWMHLYELDKQVEQKSINETDEEIVNAVKDTSVLDMVEPKQEWSEEDEKMFDFCCDYLDDNQINWLKSIKDRVKGKED